MELSNDLIAWQFIAIALLALCVMLAFANINKQKEINICFNERLGLIRKCNKYMIELMHLRKALHEYEKDKKV